jgi:Ethanolamine utilization protein EutJ (predicted chaperonin)
MIETHYEIDITTIEVSNQMAIIQVQIGKNTIKDVLLDGGASVNTITENLRTKLGLPKLN